VSSQRAGVHLVMVGAIVLGVLAGRLVYVFLGG
jgi:hypothetical protein